VEIPGPGKTPPAGNSQEDEGEDEDDSSESNEEEAGEQGKGPAGGADPLPPVILPALPNKPIKPIDIDGPVGDAPPPAGDAGVQIGAKTGVDPKISTRGNFEDDDDEGDMEFDGGDNDYMMRH
jgi:hypothetical protein